MHRGRRGPSRTLPPAPSLRRRSPEGAARSPPTGRYTRDRGIATCCVGSSDGMFAEQPLLGSEAVEQQVQTRPPPPPLVPAGAVRLLKRVSLRAHRLARSPQGHAAVHFGRPRVFGQACNDPRPLFQDPAARALCPRRPRRPRSPFPSAPPAPADACSGPARRLSGRPRARSPAVRLARAGLCHGVTSIRAPSVPLRGGERVRSPLRAVVRGPWSERARVRVLLPSGVWVAPGLWQFPVNSLPCPRAGFS